MSVEAGDREAEGLAEDEARRAARRESGNLGLITEDTRSEWGPDAARGAPGVPNGTTTVREWSKPGSIRLLQRSDVEGIEVALVVERVQPFGALQESDYRIRHRRRDHFVDHFADVGRYGEYRERLPRRGAARIR